MQVSQPATAFRDQVSRFSSEVEQSVTATSHLDSGHCARRESSSEALAQSAKG